MRVFRRIAFRTVKGDSEATLVERVQEAFTAVGRPLPPILFHLRDVVVTKPGHQVSAAQRAKKRFPSLAPFEFLDPAIRPSKQYQPGHVLSNVPPGWRASNPNGRHEGVDPEVLVAIARGIPRSFPFFSATFIFDPVDWEGTGGTASTLPARPAPRACVTMPARRDPRPADMWPHDFLSASAIVHGEAGWTSGRDLVLLATIEVPPPEEDAAALPPLGGGPQQLIERLGTVASQGLVGAPTDEESAFLDRVRPRAREVVRRAFSAIEGERFVLEIPPFVKFWLRRPMKGIPVPFPQLREAEAPDVRDTPISPKQALMDVFRPRGYEYVTGYGSPRDYCLRKRTQAHGLLSLYFGHGRWSRSLMGTLRYEGPLWHHDVSLRFAPRQAEHQHYFIFADQEMLQKVVANAGAVVDYLEQTFVPALDEIHGPAPAWWVYSSDQPVSGATASDAQ